MNYLPATQLGWLKGFFGCDSDSTWHAVSNHTHRAICGAPPGKRGDGWFYQAEKAQAITCKKCKDKMALRRQYDAKRRIA